MYRQFVLIVVLYGCMSFSETQAFRPPQCRGKEVGLTPEEMETMETCVTEYSTGGSASFSSVPMTRIGCVGKCIMKRQGLTDPTGLPIKDNIYMMFNSTLDTEVAELAVVKLGKCIDEKSSMIDVREKACKTYWPLVQCVIVAFQEICADDPVADAITEAS